MENRLYLASRSPRRRELLTQIGVPFSLLLFRTGERTDEAVDETPLPNEIADDYVVRVARAKARFGEHMVRVRHLTPLPVLSADTTVELDGRIYGKPVDADEAIAMLRAFSGRTHRVLTTVVVAWQDRCEHCLNINEVRFRDLDEREIHTYVNSGEPMDKAGAYGIQGVAAKFVAEMRGEHSGVVGLPLCATTLLLRKFGFAV